MRQRQKISPFSIINVPVHLHTHVFMQLTPPRPLKAETGTHHYLEALHAQAVASMFCYLQIHMDIYIYIYVERKRKIYIYIYRERERYEMNAHFHYQPHATSPAWQPGLRYTAVGNSKRGLIY